MNDPIDPGVQLLQQDLNDAAGEVFSLRKRVKLLEEELASVRICFSEASHAAGPTTIHVEQLHSEREMLRDLVGELAEALDMADGIDGPADEMFWRKRGEALAKAKEALG